MHNSPTWLRTTLSIPVYATSAVFWILTVYLIVTASVKMLSRFVRPEQIGEGVVDLLVAVALAALGSGLWKLGRYIRTSSFKRPAKATLT
ncbi:hypothetical protein BLL37_15140 [Pseudomonas azotoformans]|uniref:Uncharacterized protein n=1 Tax=Pseudomonas azotoformans TaxID=47878 RepID=A0A1V2JH63_PSEAZ|nr:hypothetical protein [Pseudomonas azotoformans]OIN46204.1 hypothetical protein BFL39_21095 [Pseudomonas azotoformans]ONH44660.1 hypothetical protein BLL37_15140 [Pseudomonas azotoformans]SDN19364.1 hypothetical protein SAMN04489799_1350 [Pseudomonas azotoformans]